MPGRNRTGPHGAGPRTGRGLGYCGSSDQSSSATPGQGVRAGFGFGRGGAGRGWRHRFFATGVPGWVPQWGASVEEPAAAPGQETADLKDQVEQLKGELDALQKRIEMLTTK